ncbi:MAG: ABC transporter permease [Desulfobacteraceae bacterium]|nr:ABC transporter permease [Desulfobacteraceae bacterium]
MKNLRSSWLVAGLVWADLKHEWILSLCLILAVAAVIGPLLLLFGLKNGTMETLRTRLLQDPRNREIRPMVSRSFTQAWLDKLKSDPGATFLVPTTRSISASVSLKSTASQLTLEALPTADGDPLLLENQAAPPGSGQCVLSAEAARKLNVKPGKEITLTIRRFRGRGFETGNAKLKISGVLDPRATARDAVYFPLGFLENIEDFKDGRAVPRLGWKGDIPKAVPVFDGVVLGMNTPVDPVLKVRLTSGTGLSRLEEIPRDQQLSRLGYELNTRKFWYLLTTKRAQSKAVVTTIQRRLRGKNAVVLPWVKPIKMNMRNDRVLPLLAYPRTPGLDAPWPEGVMTGKHLRQIILPRGFDFQPGISMALEEKSSLLIPAFPVQDWFTKGAWLLAPPDLVGILNLSRQRDIIWEKESDQFVLKRRGYAAFRLYAKTLDDVETLKLRLEGEGIPVHTEASRIRDLKELDRHLGMIFWLIGLGGLLGGAGSLTASLYASVERKRRDLGVLGLIGFGRTGLLCLPLYQALFLTLGGLGMALVFYLGMAGFINHLFSAQLAQGESFCRLGAGHLAYAAAGVVILGQIAAALAAARVIRIDPAEALRDE